MGKGDKPRFQAQSVLAEEYRRQQWLQQQPGGSDSVGGDMTVLYDSSEDSCVPPLLDQQPGKLKVVIKQECIYDVEDADPDCAISNNATSTTVNEELASPSIKRKKVGGTSGPSLQQGKGVEEELCLICGDRASGYHYNALSCEGCKGFFRRSVTRGAHYACKYGGQCEMDMWMRRKCQSCRLRRCREVGMKEECLLSDDQCKARDARRKARQRVAKKTSKNERQQQYSPDTSHPTQPSSSTEKEPPSTVNPLQLMSPENRDLVEKLVFYQDKYEIPSQEDLCRVTSVKISDSCRPKDLNEVIFKQMSEMTVLVTYLIVEFAKNLPEFNELQREDQIVLLKGSACEVMMLRTARRYDLDTDTIVFGNGMPYTRDNLRFAGLKDYVDSMFKFCNGMGVLAVDNAEYALITSICIFSDRPGLKDPHAVEMAQSRYVAALMEYDKLRRRKSRNFFAKLLMKLTDLRSLSVEHSDILFSIRVEKGSLPPLLSEYFDIAD